MEEVTQEILQSIANFQKEMEKTFREFWDKFSKYTVSLGMFEPLVDIEDRSDEVVIYMDLPGFSKNEIKIKVTEDSVEVRAEKSIERKNVEKERKYFTRQRFYEGFYKRILLPVKVRPEQARAKLENGVLEIHIPKSEAAREVEVNVE
ncbi:MAG: Hsp20/alpha crystallin family protein [Thermoproteales archaeon]|nr:Hsp20/alpha crystallin family protein [Thermoproteales archaeon]